MMMMLVVVVVVGDRGREQVGTGTALQVVGVTQDTFTSRPRDGN
jgi:hypothetical protein